MEHEGLLPCWLEPATGPYREVYPKPDESSQHPHPYMPRPSHPFNNIW
jgi:hypothetical protein